LQTPLTGDHSAFARLGYLGIGIVFAAFGGFSLGAPLDSAAVAPGRIAAESATKPIQHLEGGLVREVVAKEAMPVRKGDVLFRLEPIKARANQDMLLKQFDAALAQERRLVAERDKLERIEFPDALQARRSVPETAAAIADQEKRFADRRQILANETKIMRARLAQAEKERAGFERQEKSLRQQIDNLSTEIANVEGLANKGLYPRNKLNVLLRERSRLEGQQAAIESDLARGEEAVREARLQVEKLEQRFVEEAAQQLPEIRSRLSDLAEKMAVADDVMSRVEVRAPQNGIVQGIKVHAAAVVKPGDVIAELVPLGDKLVVSARVSPLDIDNVAPAQRAEVRFPAFASRGVPTIFGRVETVAADATVDEYTREPYFVARITVDLQTVQKQIQERLVPGMPADVLIVTGERTLFQYLMSPITDLLFKSMREH
jgi:HlyD family secretion protein